MPISVAIIGAGPSGFYAAEALLRADFDCRVDFIEALPSPFGLIRSGVAPDHQHIKAVVRAYDRTARDEHVAYYGNVTIGRDVSLEQLRQFYDAVIIATGAPFDRSLEIPGGDLPGVYGSAAFVGWYNGHPDHQDLAPVLDSERVCVIGHGNVALDVGRVLVKTASEMADSDLPDYAARVIHGAPVRLVTLFGRRGPAEAKFTNTELKELAKLGNCVPRLDPTIIPASPPADLDEKTRRVKGRNLKTFRGFAAIEKPQAAKELRFEFYAQPVEILGEDRVTGIRFERTTVEQGRAAGTGDFFDYDCGTVVAAIGTKARPLDGLPFDKRAGVVVNRKGRIAKGLYVVGWAKRGPIGVIGSNKSDADTLPALVGKDLSGKGKPGRAALERWLTAGQTRWVSYEDWQAIDAAEIDAAKGGAPRKKLYRIKDMLAVLGQDARCAR
jgi:ferredoxin--NADP+ reductase